MVLETDGELMRIYNIGKHRGLSRRWGGLDFEREVVSDCVARIEPILRTARPTNGEDVVTVLARHFSVQFEEVRGSHDIDALERKYLAGKGELGFAQLRPEMADKSVDALLFQRMEAKPDDEDK